MQLILPHLGFLSFLGPNQCLDEYSKPFMATRIVKHWERKYEITLEDKTCLHEMYPGILSDKTS